MKEYTLTSNQLKTISYILESCSIEEAARKAKVSRSSIYNWLKDDIFKEKLKKEREALFAEGLDLLKQATNKAVNELINLLKSRDETTRRLTAKEIINLSLRTTEIRDLEERISKIEQIIEQNIRIYKKEFNKI
jgi:transposase